MVNVDPWRRGTRPPSPPDAGAADEKGLWAGRLFPFAVLPSTNRWALDHLSELRHGDLVWAREQTAGVGRFDRAWVSGPEGGLTLSVVLCDPSFRDVAPHIGQAAAWAVRETVAAYGIAAFLKWPNDVMADDRKIAGVLVQGSGDAFVAGIGLNVNLAQEDLDAGGISQTATSLRNLLGYRVPMEGIFAALRSRLEKSLSDLAAGGPEQVLALWRHCDWLQGARISVRQATHTAQGKYLGIDRHGRLILEVDYRRTVAIDAGDVQKVSVAPRR